MAFAGTLKAFSYMPFENAKAIVEMLQRSSLSLETKGACLALVNDRVCSTQGLDLPRTNAHCQKVMHMHSVYTYPELTHILGNNVGQTHKLLLMAERCRRLGIVRPSEKSVAAIVAILYGDAEGVRRARPGAFHRDAP